MRNLERFIKGRNPLKFDEDNLTHPLNIEWYDNQIDKCLNGYEYNGERLTADHYWYLNFVPITRLIEDNEGNLTDYVDIDYPYWCQADDYLFKQIEEAKQSKMDVMLFTQRGFGKTFMCISFPLRLYALFPETHSLISASIGQHAEKTFNDKLIPCLNKFEKLHPTLKQKRIVDKQDIIKAGEEIRYANRKELRGSNSILERLSYDNMAKSDGMRLDFQLFEEVGSWEKNPSLKQCVNKSKGTWYINKTTKRCFVMYIGTGGNVLSDQAKDMMFNPKAYNLYVPKEHSERPHSLFVPAYMKLGKFFEKKGAIYAENPLTKQDEYYGEVEIDGVPNVEAAKKWIEQSRQVLISDIEAYNMEIQQNPLTVDEVFMKNTTKVFNSLDLAQQHTYITQKVLKKGEDYTLFKGDLEWTDNGSRVVFKPNDNGAFTFTELPKGHENGTVLKNLYCMGVDSIDMGNNDSADKSGKGRSKLAMLVKKRISPDFTNVYNNSYVCMYLNRSDEVEDDYENVMKCAIFFNAQIMLEYTRTNIKTYFKQHKQDWRFCKRPDVASSSLEESGSTIGFKASPQIINHYVSCIKHYLKETSCKTIVFEELLNQLIDYTYEDKGKFDLIAAMGGCELHDEQLRINHIAARESIETVQNIGWFIDKNGRKQFGVKPADIPLKQVQSEWDIIDYIDETDKKNIKIVRK